MFRTASSSPTVYDITAVALSYTLVCLISRVGERQIFIRNRTVQRSADDDRNGLHVGLYT